MALRILIDTNVLIDSIAEREPFCTFSDKIIDLCRKELVSGTIASHSILNSIYILRKQYSLPELKELFLTLCEILYIESVDFEKIIHALTDNDFSDFEDCLQMQCAVNFKADFIVTRNVKDFKAGKIPAVTPEDFCKLFEQEDR